MPFVHIRMIDDGVTPEQKATVIREVTDTLVRVLGKNPETTNVVIDLYPPDGWGQGGELVSERRRRAAGG